MNETSVGHVLEQLFSRDIHGVVCVGTLIPEPEVWFQDFLENADECADDCFVAVCHQTLDSVEDFLFWTWTAR